MTSRSLLALGLVLWSCSDPPAGTPAADAAPEAASLPDGGTDGSEDSTAEEASVPDAAEEADSNAGDGPGDAGSDDGASKCTSDAACDDGIFCNGQESCNPSSFLADAVGCVKASAAPCSSGQICDEPSQSCKSNCQVNADADGDGSLAVPCGGLDCDDTNAKVGPGATEVCNAVDDDCDGVTDEGLTNLYTVDADGDGYGSASASAATQLACTKPTGFAMSSSDCDDASATIHPGAAETCDGADNNCNGGIDEANALGCSLFYLDADADGFGTVTAQCSCSPSGKFTTKTLGDCDDSNSAAHPGAAETCNGFDDNCDGVADPAGANGCTPKYADQDQDGWGTTLVQCVCGSPFPYTASQAGDCCDFDPKAKPGAVSYSASVNACGSWDYNCNGIADKEFGQFGACSGYMSCQATQGWVKPLVGGSIPDCGAVAEFVRTTGSQSCTLPMGSNYCSNGASTQTQRCR